MLRQFAQELELNDKEYALAKDSALELWREDISGSCNLFTEQIMDYDNAPHQEEWYGVLDNEAYKKIAVAAPRGHTKTTCFSVNYPLHLIAKDPNERILLVSNTDSQSQSFLREIVANIERNENYVEYAGQLRPQIPEKWTHREIIVKRDNTKLKDPTISTASYGGTILSKRATTIICDDILNEENTRTYEQRQKLRNWFYEVLLPVLVPGGRVIFVGTVWHPDDLLHEILGDGSWDFRKKYQAVIQPPTHGELWEQWYAMRLTGEPDALHKANAFFQENKERMFEGVEVLWPSYFTYDYLFPIKKSNSVAFEKSYQNNIVSREDQKFSESSLKRAKDRGRNYKLVRALSEDQRTEYIVLTTGNDLAASEKEQADDLVVLTLGLRRQDNMIMLLNIERGKVGSKTGRKWAVENNQNFRPDVYMVENNAYQVAMEKDLADYNIPVKGFNTTGEKFDPFVGVESLALIFENDRIILPYDNEDPRTIEMVDQLVDELRQFPAGHTGDSAMAFWFAFTAMRNVDVGDAGGWMGVIEDDLKRAESGDISSVTDWIKSLQTNPQDSTQHH